MKKNIAIDGPAGSGKSTIAKLVAEQIGYTYISTGLMYRAIALNAKTLNIDLNKEELVIKTLKPGMIKLLPNDVVDLNGVKLSEQLRSDEISNGASKVATYEKVREYAVKEQQDMAKTKGFVMDGRDITSVVLPDAEVKIFMWATPEERAKRRVEQNVDLGFSVDYEKILKEINDRDYQDSNRIIGPLIQVPDAVKIDTTTMSIEDVVKQIIELI